MKTKVKNPSYTLDQETRAVLRSKIFRHLDGMAVAPVILAFSEKNIISKFLERERLTLSEITHDGRGNEGYINVGLRLLCSQGWLKRKRVGQDVEYSITEKGKILFASAAVYKPILDFLNVGLNFRHKFETGFSEEELEVLEDVLTLKAQNWKLDFYQLPDDLNFQVKTHLEGIVIGPVLVSLGMSGWMEETLETGHLGSEFERHQLGAFIRTLFVQMAWVNAETDMLTAEGMFMLKRSSAYGVTTSYFQTFSWVDELLFGKADKLWDKDLETPEIHVDRTLNVWGSGGAHATYFNVVDDIVRTIFNRPIEDQPKGIADMGCGNGAFLEHLYFLVKNETERGKVMDEHPLLIIGSDFNEAALVSTRETLDKAGIEHLALHGDIGNPQGLADELNLNFEVNLGDLLNVRSFLDHNRIFTPCEGDFENRSGKSTGAFVFRGRRLRNEEIEQNLFEHFTKWAPFVKKFGLLVIELHTIDPEIAAKNLGKVAITAYDGTHGFTDQYIVEHDIFVSMADEAGLHADKDVQALYPNPAMPVVSINLLRSETS